MEVNPFNIFFVKSDSKGDRLLFRYTYTYVRIEMKVSRKNVVASTPMQLIRYSIYARTRIVKMRVLNEGKYKLYKCCKCDNFVEPAAVSNHAATYDTCVKVKCSYPCKICKRTFNNRLVRNNHAKNKSDEAYEIVLFNHVKDKEFNEKLTADKFKNDMSSSSTLVCKVLYKCLCGLCFVKKETADKHKMTCPGKDTKHKCPECNNLFDRDEFLVHFENPLACRPM